jgi:predicted short-subunit dehydrogenase-like oxidoreductase (DUF2520 family)
MRELERQTADTPPCTSAALKRVGVVGRGRVGTALASALRAAGYSAGTPAARGEIPPGDAILLCVPDAEIPAAAEAVAGAAPFVGHTSGATPLSALEAATRGGSHAFGLHPLQTFTEAGAELAGCGCAVAGSTPEALELAHRMALDLGMTPFEVLDGQRAAYHAAASISSNYLVTLQAEAEALAAAAGIDGFDARTLLGPLVRTTTENWIALGARRALTGPIARGDEATVSRQREAVAAARPEAVAMFDALAERTRSLAAQEVAA